MAEPACRFIRYCIFNPATDELKSAYQAALPALYVSYSAAHGELRKQKKKGMYMHYEVREAEIAVR
ncbi:MAG: hypothetical protein FWD68_08540 [Alphaproteobacteria bacterium]|nr:hypothetical protein [Alphaproteobacteria bacterium]